MKILHVIDSGGLYGAEVMLLNLVSEQLDAGLEPLILSIGVPGEEAKPVEQEARRSGLPVKSVRFRAGLNFRAGFRLLREARQAGFHLIHSHGYKGNILLGLFPTSLRRMPMLATLHGWTSTGRGLTKMRIYEWLDSRCLARLDSIVFVNDQMLKHRAFRSVPQAKKHVVYNGIALDDTHDVPVAAEIRSFCQRGWTIVAVGRFSPEKNFSALVEAVGQLVQGGADLQLLLLGDGGQRDLLSSLIIQYGLEKRVMMPGYVENVDAVLNLCRLFVMPSLTEGLPMALLEAMKAEIPIVASRVGGIPEALENGRAGRLITPGNLSELIAALEECSAPSAALELKDYALRARNRLEQKFTSRRMAESYLRIYQQLSGTAL